MSFSQRVNPRPFRAREPAERDPRVPGNVWDLPRRVEQANQDGPRYTQMQLAEAAGLAQAVISRLMSWKALYGIRLETIYKLAAALNVSVPWLLGETTVSTRDGERR